VYPERPARRRERSTRAEGAAAPHSLLFQLKRNFLRDLNFIAEALGLYGCRKWLLGAPFLQNMRQAASLHPLAVRVTLSAPYTARLSHATGAFARSSFLEGPHCPGPCVDLLLVGGTRLPSDCLASPGHPVPANACSYSERELATILNAPRGFKPGEPRYYFHGGGWTS